MPKDRKKKSKKKQQKRNDPKIGVKADQTSINIELRQKLRKGKKIGPVKADELFVGVGTDGVYAGTRVSTKKGKADVKVKSSGILSLDNVEPSDQKKSEPKKKPQTKKSKQRKK